MGFFPALLTYKKWILEPIPKALISLYQWLLVCIFSPDWSLEGLSTMYYYLRVPLHFKIVQSWAHLVPKISAPQELGLGVVHCWIPRTNSAYHAGVCSVKICWMNWWTNEWKGLPRRLSLPWRLHTVRVLASTWQLRLNTLLLPMISSCQSPLLPSNRPLCCLLPIHL